MENPNNTTRRFRIIFQRVLINRSFNTCSVLAVSGETISHKLELIYMMVWGCFDEVRYIGNLVINNDGYDGVNDGYDGVNAPVSLLMSFTFRTILI